MFYDKKIRYLNYYENDSRVKGAGYMRTEAKGQRLRMELNVTGLHPTDSFEREIFLCAGKEEKSIGVIKISGGKGQYLEQWPDSSSIGGTGIDYAELEGIHIPLGANRELSCRWQAQQISSVQNRSPKKDNALPGKKTPVLHEPSQAESQEHVEITAKTEHASKRETSETENPKTEVQTVHKPSPAKPPEQVEIQATASESVQKKDMEEQRESPARTPTIPPKLLEDKWEQLWSLYPHLRPFQDKREYLSIKPADFVIFSSSSYRMSNNSFLLHGYYNYKHLILTRIEKRGEIRYYVGVPGNFFEKEKQVAIMFGFESFECAEEPAQAGDFGYYMMRIEI